MHPYRIGLVFSYMLGHVTHHQNLASYFTSEANVLPRWFLTPPHADDLWDRLPFVRGHMPLRMSLRSHGAILREHRIAPLEVLYYHTQITGMLRFPLAPSIPTVLSVDATPIDFAAMSAWHANGDARPANRNGLGFRWNRAVFNRATAIISFSNWARRSLVSDYGVDPARIFVIPSGVDLKRWTPGASRSDPSQKLRLLFVGGNFRRKGGEVLLNAFSQLRDICELDIVSDTAPAGDGSVRVHRNVKANSAELRQLFHKADLFVFPTRADCTPFVTMEAMASGLPIVTTHVGSLSEQVLHGHNGLIVPPDDAGAVAQAVRALANDPARRLTMGLAGRALAERSFDASINYPAVIRLLKQCADTRREGITPRTPTPLSLAPNVRTLHA